MHGNCVVVSVVCMVYNHEKYLRKALDGFVMQKTDFQFEVIIHDDASTDASQKIVREYVAKYPKVFRPIYQVVNQYSIEIGRVTQICFKACKGKYIAICEGDDYWTDSEKLKKQVDFLENNKDYSLCFHRVNRYQEGIIISDIKKRKAEETLLTLARNVDIPTLSVVFRKINFNEFYDVIHKHRGSHFMFMLLAKHGKFKFIDETMAVYRVHSGGIWSGKSIFGRAQMQLQNKKLMIDYFADDKMVQREIIKSYIDISTMYFLKLAYRKQIKLAFKIYSDSLKYGMFIFHVKSLIRSLIR